MKKYKELADQYNALDERYDSLLSEKAQLEYRLISMERDNQQILEQENEIRILHENIRKLKHDMKNHMMVIASYMTSEDYDGAEEYTSKILGKLNSIHSYIETGNSLLNHIVNEKLAQAREKGISVKAEIENLSFERMDSLDFSALLSNMLDNAIEASQKEKTPEIILSIVKKRSYETVLVRNSISKSVLDSNPELLSSKQEKNHHGFGVKQIKELAEKYGGQVEFFEEDGYFCACVMIEATNVYP